jgi:hypothetical protein
MVDDVADGKRLMRFDGMWLWQERKEDGNE